MDQSNIVVLRENENMMANEIAKFIQQFMEEYPHITKTICYSAMVVVGLIGIYKERNMVREELN